MLLVEGVGGTVRPGVVGAASTVVCTPVGGKGRLGGKGRFPVPVPVPRKGDKASVCSPVRAVAVVFGGRSVVPVLTFPPRRIDKALATLTAAEELLLLVMDGVVVVLLPVLLLEEVG